jgi:hypothetical protein
MAQLVKNWSAFQSLFTDELPKLWLETGAEAAIEPKNHVIFFIFSSLSSLSMSLPILPTHISVEENSSLTIHTPLN